MFSFSQAEFVYEPYPICCIKNVFSDAMYEALLRTYPDVSLFQYMPRLGDKYSLSERNNRSEYVRFLQTNPEWSRLHDYIKHPEFISATLEFLSQHNIDLGLGDYAARSVTKKAKPSLASRLAGRAELSARFEFSMMGGQGGHIRPHTDEPKKLITLVFSMIEPGTWDDAWGGGTQTCLPKDRSLIYNQVNRYLEFGDVDVLHDYKFHPNQCLLFIKTYNSWHQVSPMSAPPNAPMRRTLTLNIERLN